MKQKQNGDNAFIEKAKTLNISTPKKTAAQLAAEKEPTLNCHCGQIMEPTHAFQTPVGKLVRYVHRRRQHDDRHERSLSA